MTTNHRPTLESKRGRDVAIKNTIQHARSGPGQKSLKLRLDISGAQIDHVRGRKALDELERETKRHKTLDEFLNTGSFSQVEGDGYESFDQSSSEELLSVAKCSDDDDSDEDDTNALMEELRKVREEKKSCAKQNTALISNPLIASDGSDTVNKKTSWRSSAIFSKAKKVPDQSFTTDTLNSDTHKQFLAKYFR
ncbi:hypothetical protein METBIDRAFT_47358 [Metschnikowia bicuspidata var. bicuspidata NRRL YB-4993]|uniref:Pre-mRNA-splicing factor CWC15 n=1 Tax=Metschnikowia bicuspidata var. bicuspidata NRRL YB-4993 TaxID=869754 RepID=A0A1A0H4R5_9ASCO|nr:hypothetical protein METBIDRAFT_47358 [Metschnikowia bicuspidata var. bicuspidata NRRL YB-4993]OBA19069.1 hypothetical protein METBIDRAFT_47358 [Metschnikowia bicuspidata var. bicuspidata NRRL YB-4993]